MGSTNKHYSSIFPRSSTPAALCEQICSAITRERIRRERIRLVVSSLTGTSSLAGLVFALPALVQAASTSGFITYTQILFTDSDLAFTNIRTFLLPIVEALPGIETMLTLFCIAVLLVSISNFVRSLTSNQLTFRHV